MITDARVLRDEFLPDQIRQRNQELNALAHALDPVTDGDPGDPVFLFGPPGTGKTCLSRHILEQLREEALDIETQYVNAWQYHSPFRVLQRLVDGLGRGADIHRQSTPRDELVHRLSETDDRSYVIILDEVDQLDDLDVLYDLHRLGHVTPILIANKQSDLFERFEDRLLSRYRHVPKIRVEPYTLDALVAILEDRVRWGLRKDAIDREGIMQIADAAAGDAREAIVILRTAARKAAQRDADQITESIIETAVSEGRDELMETTLDRLNSHQRTLYELIAERTEVPASDIYEAYDARVDDPKSDRQVRNYLTKLEHYNLIESEGDTRWRTYRVATK